MLRIGVGLAFLVALVAASAATSAAPPRVGDFSCYAAGGPPLRKETVVLRDEVRSERVRVTSLFRLCLPARISTSRPGRAHLTCYAITPRKALARSVLVRNRLGRQTLELSATHSLCTAATVGSDALSLVRGPDPEKLLDSFKCYRAASETFNRRSLVVTDRLRGRKRVALARPSAYCAPTAKRRGKKRAQVRNADREACLLPDCGGQGGVGDGARAQRARALRAAHAPARRRVLDVDEGDRAASTPARATAPAAATSSASTTTPPPPPPAPIR